MHGLESLAGEIAVDDRGHGEGDEPAESGADGAADEPGGRRFDDEDALDVAIAGADGFEHADLSATLPYGGEHGVGDSECGDEEGHRADAREHDLDDAEVAAYRRDEVLRCTGGVADGGDPGAHAGDVVDAVRHDERPAVGRSRRVGDVVGDAGGDPVVRVSRDRQRREELARRGVLRDDTNDHGAGPEPADATVAVGRAVVVGKRAGRRHLELGSYDACGLGSLQADALQITLRHRDLGRGVVGWQPSSENRDR